MIIDFIANIIIITAFVHVGTFGFVDVDTENLSMVM